MEREQIEEPVEPQVLPQQRSLFAEDFAPAEAEEPLGREDAVLPALSIALLRPPLAEDRVRVAVAHTVGVPVSPQAREVAVAARLYLTADLRAATGLPRTATDFYLRVGVLRPTARAESGYLLFNEHELAILRRVLEWRARGIGLREIKARLGR